MNDSGERPLMTSNAVALAEADFEKLVNTTLESPSSGRVAAALIILDEKQSLYAGLERAATRVLEMHDSGEDPLNEQQLEHARICRADAHAIGALIDETRARISEFTP